MWSAWSAEISLRGNTTGSSRARVRIVKVKVLCLWNSIAVCVAFASAVRIPLKVRRVILGAFRVKIKTNTELK